MEEEPCPLIALSAQLWIQFVSLLWTPQITAVGETWFKNSFFSLDFERFSSSFRENPVNKWMNFSPPYLKNIVGQFFISCQSAELHLSLYSYAGLYRMQIWPFVF